MTEQLSGPAGRIERLRTLMEERGYDAVVVRDEANLRWLTGARGVFDYTFEFPHAAFITADATYLHTDSRYLNSFRESLGESSPWQLDQEEGTIPDWAAARAAACRCRVVAVEDDMQIGFYRSLERGLEDRSVACSLPLMHGDIQRLRAVKDAAEIALMREAQAITDAAFTHMCSFIKPGQTEKEIRNELERFMFSQGADALAFGSIVASGPNTANPHAVPSDRVVDERRLRAHGLRRGPGRLPLRYDAHRRAGRTGALAARPVRPGAPLPRECAAAVHAGVDGNDIFLLSRRIIADAGFGEYYNHGLGHGVGIDIHEQPNFGRKRGVVPAGAVITIEPGVYLPGRGGVRLEDYGVVTEKGFEPFTASTHELVVIDC